jgi:hypothetical protein
MDKYTQVTTTEDIEEDIEDIPKKQTDEFKGLCYLLSLALIMSMALNVLMFFRILSVIR